MTTGDASSFDSTEPPARHDVTAFFDEQAAVQAAIDDLVSAGVPRAAIALVEGGAEPVAADAVPTRDKGVWERVKDLFMADEDRHAYGEGLRRGGFLLSVKTDPGNHDKVVSLLEREGAVDMDQRRAAWELEGWDPARAAADLRSVGEATANDPAPVTAAPIGSAASRDRDG